MKTSNFLSVIFVTAALIAGTTGCVHGPSHITVIPKGPSVAPIGPPPDGGNAGDKGIGNGNTIPPKSDITNGMPIPEDATGPYADVLANGIEDRPKFKSDTVYFDLDSSTIKKSEDKKLEEVANFFKTDNEDALRIEGNCDERGTEKYNLALGERRALAVREYLATLGVNPQRIGTVTFGAAKPADPGHDESAWKKNRRGDFILMTPKK